jgi:hypothetical protein
MLTEDYIVPDHCFDVLRQAILCHGDISLVYWWNRNYSYIDETGLKHYTAEYLQRTPDERLTGSFVKWDTAVQCRDLCPELVGEEAHGG